MRARIYNSLVNRHSGISYRYHRFHDGKTGFLRVLSWFYLLWLNFAYYILFLRFLGKNPEIEFYERRNLPTRCSESEEWILAHPKLSVDVWVQKLKDYDVISFDMFDTLIFRPLSQPTDVFYLIGERLGIADFKNIRIWAEQDARVRCKEKYGHTEVSLEEIWENLVRDVGNQAEGGMEQEKEIELALCYGNPFMLEVWKRLLKMGKTLIIISDMYLPRKLLASILERNGFSGAEQIYISCEYRKSKASGDLFRLIRREIGKESVIHVGDNPFSDGTMARKNGFAVCAYPNVNHNVFLYRPFDMSYLVGGAYRGIVSNHIYNGSMSYSMEYEYGYIYGGLFVLGYCGFIHDYCRRNRVDRILFLSRDGDSLKQAYEYLYPEDETLYAYWSRKAATKLMAQEDKHDYFRRFIYHKVNQGYTIREVLHSMELDILLDQFRDWKAIWFQYERRTYSQEKLKRRYKQYFIDLQPDDKLTERNGYLLRRFIEAKWEQVCSVYAPQREAAGRYYGEILKGCRRAAVVDIGWAGSGALTLIHLVETVWNIPCQIMGILAGTNTIHNAEPDVSEVFLQNGRLTAYLYSQSHNRDLLKKHDPNKDYNIFWELLLASPTPQFTGFDWNADGSVQLNFGKCDQNLEGIREIQRGILDFVHDYHEHFKAFPYMLRISGRDSYAPILAASGYKEKYLRTIKQKFGLEIHVD